MLVHLLVLYCSLRLCLIFLSLFSFSSSESIISIVLSSSLPFFLLAAQTGVWIPPVIFYFTYCTFKLQHFCFFFRFSISLLISPCCYRPLSWLFLLLSFVFWTSLKHFFKSLLSRSAVWSFLGTISGGLFFSFDWAIPTFFKKDFFLFKIRHLKIIIW